MPKDWFAEIREKVNRAQDAAPAEAVPEAPPRKTPVSDPTRHGEQATVRSSTAPTDPRRRYYRSAFDLHMKYSDPPTEPEAARAFWTRAFEEFNDAYQRAPDPLHCDLLVAAYSDIERIYQRALEIERK